MIVILAARAIRPAVKCVRMNWQETMSWDVLLTRLPYSIKSVQELPDDYQPPPLGSRDEVDEALREAAPGIDLSDPEWGVLSGARWSMELDLGVKEPVDAITCHVSGGGDDVVHVIFRLAEELQCRVLDCAAGDVITQQDAYGRHAALKDYRGR